jgi:DNA repair protein RadC
MKKSSYTIKELEVVYNPTQKVNDTKKFSIKSSKTTAEFIYKFYNINSISYQEEFLVAYLNNANNVIGIHQHSKGGITYTSVDLRIIMAIALKCFATGIIISHNHPAGTLSPSFEDRVITINIKNACKFFDIVLLDHIILTPSGEYFSFSDTGIL